MLIASKFHCDPLTLTLSQFFAYENNFWSLEDLATPKTMLEQVEEDARILAQKMQDKALNSKAKKVK